MIVRSTCKKKGIFYSSQEFCLIQRGSYLIESYSVFSLVVGFVNHICYNKKRMPGKWKKTEEQIFNEYFQIIFDVQYFFLFYLMKILLNVHFILLN